MSQRLKLHPTHWKLKVSALPVKLATLLRFVQSDNYQNYLHKSRMSNPTSWSAKGHTGTQQRAQMVGSNGGVSSKWLFWLGKASFRYGG